MTREEAKEVFLNRGFIDGIYNGDKWREACIVISKWLEQEPTTKNDLAVDKLLAGCEKMSFEIEIFNKPLRVVALDAVKNIVKGLPSVTPQEPTDKKFTKADIDAIVKAINKGWELRVNEILDKIRTELHATAEMHEDGDYYLRDEWIDEYFNKYKADVEPQESEG